MIENSKDELSEKKITGEETTLERLENEKDEL